MLTYHPAATKVVILTILFASTAGSMAGDCGPDENTLGDLELLSVSATPPDSNGIARISFSYAKAVGSGETIPTTTIGIYRNGTLVVTSDIAGITGLGGTCPVAEGWDDNCFDKCDKEKLCNNGNGTCQCKKTPSGQYSKCKCESILSSIIGISATSSDLVSFALDIDSDFAEDHECNNAIDVVVP